jgi:hypothetical protein
VDLDLVALRSTNGRPALQLILVHKVTIISHRCALNQAWAVDVHVADMANQHALASRAAPVEATRPSVVASLIIALTSLNEQVRGQAARALGEIGDPVAAPALVRTLQDPKPGVRWLAAESLIALGRAALVPLLQALVYHADSTGLREGASHVLHALLSKGQDDEIAPVSAALEDMESAQVPSAAQAALDAMTRTVGNTPGRRNDRGDSIC